MNTYKKYWEAYYKKNKNPTKESPFASFVLPFLRTGNSLYELGCGNGRDSVFFAKEGLNINAFDQCSNEIEYLNNSVAGSNLKFIAGDFTSLPAMDKVNYIYSRFTLHSVSLEQEISTLKWTFDQLLDNGLLFIEIRSNKDELYGQGEKISQNAFVTDHYRRFVNFKEFSSRIEEEGFSILYKIESDGLAIYKEENPVVIRIVAQK